MVAFAGATPWPQITLGLPSAVHAMITASPPSPFMCGSTTCSVKPAATAASNALPPFSSTPMPTWLAIQCVEETTPNVPAISGRVVKVEGAAMGGSTLFGREGEDGENIGGRRQPNTFFSSSVVRAAGFARISASSLAM